MEQMPSPVELSRARWRKSSRSGSNNCVEVANVRGFVAVRDSKNPDGPRLVFTRSGWAAFAAGLKAGDFDRLA
ncbi:DUF397 domain-containing protein [Carbonactinospora thermoautotrophica]|nr:DUF397 domain-containing protein [Carbonactinospora thermoautotrophica]